jgi:hypothetical protein
MKHNSIKCLVAAALFCGAMNLQAATIGSANFITADSAGDPTKSLHLILNTDGMKVSGAHNVMAQVYAGSTSDFGSMIAMGTPQSVGVVTGFEGYVLTGQLDFTGFVAGDTPFYAIAAWDTDFGSTYATSTVRNHSTPKATSPLGGTPDVGLSITPPNLNTFDSFQLQNVAMVPEPSTVALGIIGGLALLMRRRRS